jgi:hypothetical protein
MQKSLMSALGLLVVKKLLMELVPISSLASSSTEVLRALLKGRSEEDEFDQEFSSLIDLLHKPDPSFDLINLAFEAPRYHSKSQLCQLQAVLKAVCVKEQGLDSARTTIAGLRRTHD